MPVVAVCPEHGPFASRAIHVQNSVSITFIGNRESCPQCGRMSAIMDGAYDFNSDGFATVLAAPGWSRRALNNIQNSVQDLADAIAADNTDQQSEILARLEAQDAQLAHLVTAGIANREPNDAIALLMKILAILGGIVTLREAGGLTYEAVQLLVREFLS